jgi:hypothetical protein
VNAGIHRVRIMFLRIYGLMLAEGWRGGIHDGQQPAKRRCLPV